MKKLLTLLSLVQCSQVMTSQTINWVKNMEGLRNCEGRAITLDDAGNVYTTGYFDSIMDFDPGPGTYTLSAGTGNDIFILKLKPDGSFAWAKSYGALYSGGIGISIKIDHSGNVITTGQFYGSIDFDAGPGNQTLNSMSQDIFVLKLANNGNFIWAKNMECTTYSEGKSVTIDPSNNIILTGHFNGSVDFDPGPGSYVLNEGNINGHGDSFIMKLDSLGNFNWAGHFGMSEFNESTCITSDVAGNIYTTGYFKGQLDFDPSAGTHILSSSSHYSPYILKLKPNGNLQWVKQIGDSLNHGYGYGIELDHMGHVYSTGSFLGTRDFNPGAGTFTMTAPTTEDSYLLKLDTSGNFVWAHQMSGSFSRGYALDFDLFGNIISTGMYNGSSDIDSGPGTYTLGTTPGSTVYFMKNDPTGKVLSAKLYGAGTWCQPTSVAVDVDGSIYSTGFFEGTSAVIDFDPGPASFTLNTTDRNNNFILKLNPTNEVGINELSNKDKTIIKVFPNPNNGSFLITSTEDIKLNLINNLGEILKTIDIKKGNDQWLNTSVSSGMYFIVGQGDKQAIKHKIIVSN